MAAARAALEPEGKWDALNDDLTALFGGANEAGDGSVRYPAEFLIAKGAKA